MSSERLREAPPSANLATEIVSALDRVFGSCSSVPDRNETPRPPREPGGLAKAVGEYRRRLLLSDSDSEGGSGGEGAAFALECTERWSQRWPAADADSLTPADLQLYLSERAQSASAEEVAREREVLQDFFGWSKRRSRAPVPEVEKASTATRFRRRPVPNDETRGLLAGATRDPHTLSPVAWTPGEQSRLLDACRRRRPASSGSDGGERSEDTPRYLHALVLLGLHTGLRLEHLLTLEWAHVDLDARTIRLPAELVGRDRPLEVRLTLDATRTLSSLREGIQVLPTPPARVLAAVGLPERAGKPHEETVLRDFLGACERARVRPGSFESLRHTFGANCVRGGVPFLKTVELLDWDDVGVVVELYHSGSPDGRAAVRALARRRDPHPEVRAVDASLEHVDPSVRGVAPRRRSASVRAKIACKVPRSCL